MVLFPDRRSSDEENLGVDWVIRYRFDGADTTSAIEEFRTLIRDLDEAGLRTQVRHGNGSSLLVFVNAPRERLGHEIFKSRVKDWLDGVSDIRPVGDSQTVIDGDTEAEELRSVHHLVTGRKDDGGAEVTANRGKWKNITACFPLHSPNANRGLFRRWSRIRILEAEDLDGLRALFGEKVALYFAFGQCYGFFLAGAAVFATLSWMYYGPYSIGLSVISSLWCIVFVEYWKVQQTDLAIRWGSRGAREAKVNRLHNVWDKGSEGHETTLKTKEIYQAEKQLLRQLPQFVFALAASLIIGSLVLVAFTVELLLSEVYRGPFKAFLDFLPTISLALSLPTINSVLNKAAARLTDYENYPTEAQYEVALTQKTFVSRFITYFLPLLLTAFIYVPFGDRIGPSLDAAHLTWLSTRIPRHIDSRRLQQQVISFVLMTVMLQFRERNFLPRGAQISFMKYLHYLPDRPADILHPYRRSNSSSLLLIDHPEESGFLSRVRDETEASVRDVQDNLLEICVQFGYLALFGAAWPLVPLVFLFLHWTGFRSELFKTIMERQRPAPLRTDTIGPCLRILEFVAWMGCLSTAAIVHLYRRDVRRVELWSLLLTIFVAEQFYYVARYFIRSVLQKIGSETIHREEARRDAVQRRYMETFSEEAAELCRVYKPRVRFNEIMDVMIETNRRDSTAASSECTHPSKDETEDGNESQIPQKISRRTNTDLLRDAEKSTRFWSWYQTPQETIEAGIKLIEAISVASRLGRSSGSGQVTPKKAD
ncbi:plasma membrane stress response protein [Paecilomyces variotii No. 5]|uniref:Plasma membrane stress response protein n=1 Tax=Byssochlamys spectabilis (strain No. 5 / NBRC 109023) TaxID=1356009 RepID=V5FFQ1_BYSSN|nr:plasma membrane stress response protein [Paecilomyces variotii No. 5]